MWTIKKKEQVAISGPFARPQLKKKKKKKEFYFIVIPSDWKSIREGINPKKLDKLWGELSDSKRKDLLRKMKLDPNLSKDDFDQLPPNVKKTFTDKSEDDLLQTLSLIAGASLIGLYINILDAPVDKPIDKIKDEPRDREPSFDEPSSFVGRVIYTPEIQTMEINLNGRVYGFCGVPERTFDSFEGAGSKGAFFNRAIKGQFDC